MTVHRSHAPDIEIAAVTLSQLVAAAVGRFGDHQAVVEADTGRSLTYTELGVEIGRVAAGFRSRGMRSGDVVAIVAPNSIDWLVAGLGVITAGGAVTGANPAYVVEELAHQLRDSEARWVLAGEASIGLVTAAAAEAGSVDEVMALGEVPRSEVGGSPEPVDLDAVCALPYSSGTTGRSKGVRLTHRTLVANVSQVAAVAPVGEGDRVLAFLPLFHIMGFAVVALGALVKGATLVTLPAFEPEPFLDAISRYRVTNFFVVPPIANFLVSHPLVDEYDLSSVSTIGCGAAPLGVATEDALRARIGCAMAQGYGMTESSGCISYPAFADPAASGSSGGLLPNTEALVVDPETGARLGVGATGELWFRGPQVFAGYLNNAEATAETIDSEGWVHTGDIGHFDASGYLHITDRLKELIKVKGFQVAPAELEALLASHPDVLDAAVIGRPDERSGERPVAYVVGGPDADPAALIAWAAERTSAHKHLAEVVLVESIARNPSGKILRRTLREFDASRGL